MRRILLFALALPLAAQTYNIITVTPNASASAVGQLRFAEKSNSPSRDHFIVQGPDTISGDVIYKFDGSTTAGCLKLGAVSGGVNTVTTDATCGGGTYWTLSGSDIYYSAGKVGIGLTTPREHLEVNGAALISGTTTIDNTKVAGLYSIYGSSAGGLWAHDGGSGISLSTGTLDNAGASHAYTAYSESAGVGVMLSAATSEYILVSPAIYLSGLVNADGLQVHPPATPANIPSWDAALHVFSPFAKDVTPSGGYGFIKIFSNNQASPSEEYLQGNVGIITDPSPANRRLIIEAIEQGSGGREVTINEQAGGLGGVGGGNIGLRGRADSDAYVRIESDFAVTSYKEMLKLDGLTLGNGWSRGIGFWGVGGGGSYLEVGRVSSYLNGTERHLRLTSAGTVGLTVRESGSIGIGTGDPAAQLTVQSALNSTGYTEMFRLEGQTLSNGWERGITFTGNAGALEVARISGYLTGSERHLRLAAAGTVGLTVRESGYVGVGYGSPRERLEVNGAALVSGTTTIDNTKVAGLYSTYGASAGGLWAHDGGSGISLSTGTLDNSGASHAYTLYSETSGTGAILMSAGTIGLAGTVSIGVTGSTQCLHVDSAGTISGTGADCATQNWTSTGGGIYNSGRVIAGRSTDDATYALQVGAGIRVFSAVTIGGGTAQGPGAHVGYSAGTATVAAEGSGSGEAVQLLTVNPSGATTSYMILGAGGTLFSNSGGYVFVGGDAAFSAGVQVADWLRFNGATSSEPAWKRSSTTIQARLADDSGYAGVAVKELVVNGTAGFAGNVTPAANNTYDLGSASFQWASIYGAAVYSAGDFNQGGSAFTLQSGKIAKYGNAATAGMGAAPIYAVVSLVNQTGAVGSTALQVGGAMAPAGTYRINVWMACHTTGSGSATLTVSYTGGGVARTLTWTLGMGSTLLTQGGVPVVIKTDGATDITYAVSYSSTGAYDLELSAERVS